MSSHVSIEVEIIHTTELAYLIRTDDGEAWLPRSQCTITYTGPLDISELTIPTWLWEKHQDIIPHTIGTYKGFSTIKEIIPMYTIDRTPGKFEGNESQLIAQVLHDLTMISGQDDQCGSVQNDAWHGLILGKKYGFIVTEDRHGFFDYHIFDTPHEAQTYWNKETIP